MMNKKKLCIIIVIAIIVTGLAVTFAVLSKSGKHKENVNAESTCSDYHRGCPLPPEWLLCSAALPTVRSLPC